MEIFSWTVLGIAAVLLVLSGLCWLLVFLDDARWRKFSVMLFRYALVAVLLYINGLIWGNVAGALG